MDLLSRFMKLANNSSSHRSRGSFDQPENVIFERAQLVVVSREIL